MYFIKNDRVFFVSSGFNWFAFLFVWGWLLSRGLWKQGIIIMLIYIPLYFISSSLNLSLIDGIKKDEAVYLIPLFLIIIIHLFVGMKANTWRKASLIEQGYKTAKQVDY